MELNVVSRLVDNVEMSKLTVLIVPKSSLAYSGLLVCFLALMTCCHLIAEKLTRRTSWTDRKQTRNPIPLLDTCGSTFLVFSIPLL